MKKLLLLGALTIVVTNALFSQNLPSYVPTNGLVGYWPFEGNANDASGKGNHGTVNGAILTTDRNGVINNAYSFNGSNQKITVNDNNTLSFTNAIFTTSYWVNIKTPITNGSPVVCKYGITKDFEYGDFFYSDNNSSFGTWNLGGTCGVNGNSITNTTNYQNNWHHIVSVHNGLIGSSLYIDGNLYTKSNSSNSSCSMGNGSGNLYFGFGGGWNQQYYFNGLIDDIAIYNRALTQEEVTALYSSTPVSQNIPSYVPKDGLVGYWPFNGNANDESGNGNHGTVNGATLSTDRNDKAKSAYSFDGQKDFIQCLKSGPIKNASSTSVFWLKSTQQSYAHIIGYGDDGNEGKSYRVTINQNCNSCIAFDTYGNEKGFETQFSNMWDCYAVVYDSTISSDISNVKIYKNGALLTNISFLQNITNTDISSILPITFGRFHGTVQQGFFSGILDDITIYNRALTQQEITALYTGGNQSTLSSTKVYVDAPATVKQNDTLELSISTEALNSSDNVIAFQTDFAYDSTRYTYISNQIATSINPAATVDVNTSKKGLIKLGYMTQTALNGAGSLVKLKFKANNTLGQGVFGLSNFLYNTTAITSLKSDTVNTIDGIAPTGKISYSGNPVRKGDSLLITVNFSEKMAIAPVPQVNLSGQNTLANANLTKVNDTTYTYWWVVEKGNGLVNVTLASGKDLAGNNIVATPTQNASFTVLPTIFGDIDTNKFVQAYDGALALQYSVGLNPLPTMDALPWSNWRIAVANVDTVGNITANDASLILQKSIDKIASFPADAKKRGDAPVANITVTQEANQLVFRATGTLYAFNVFMKDNFNAFGQPEVKDKNAMIATNITSTTYNVGLASTTPFAENEPFLVIPILTNDNLQGTMDIVSNAQEKALAYGTAASIAAIQNDAMVVYPNPTKDLVTIKNAQGKTLRIVDFQGRLVNTQIVTSNAHDVSLKTIATKGEYIFQLIGENNETIATQKVVMQ